MSRTSSFLPSRWAVVLLAAATLALAGCGRKGGLDLPPNAPTQPGATQTESRTPANIFDPSASENKEPAAAKGRKRSFILDPLLD